MRKEVNKDLLKYQGDPEGEVAFRNLLWERQMYAHEKNVELGLQLLEDFKTRIQSGNKDRWSLLTVRPPHGTDWEIFLKSCNEFIAKWGDKWSTCEYAYEQKGESIETMGHGFHWHILICTQHANYYRTHIVRDAQRLFTYVAANCIQVDSIRNLDRARAYIRGEKEASKMPAVTYDRLWRKSMGIEELFLINGQVQAVDIREE